MDKIITLIDKFKFIFLLFLLSGFSLPLVVVEEFNNYEIVTHIVCLLVLCVFVCKIVNTTDDIKKRFFRFLVVLVVFAYFDLFVYEPYTYSVSLFCTFVLFVACVYCILKKNIGRLWFLLIPVAEIIDVRFSLFFLPVLFVLDIVQCNFDEVDNRIRKYLIAEAVGVLVLVAEHLLKIRTIYSVFQQNSMFTISYVQIICLAIAFMYTMAKIKMLSNMERIDKILIGAIGACLLMQCLGVYSRESLMIVWLLLIFMLYKTREIKLTLKETVMDCKNLFMFFAMVSVLSVYKIGYTWFNDVWKKGNEYMFCHYYLSYYEFGFVQRGLVGTIVQFFFGYTIPAPKMNMIILGMQVIGVLVFIGLAFWTIKKYGAGKSKIIYILVLIMMSTSAFLGYYHMRYYSNVDVFGMLIVYVCVLLIIKNKYTELIPVLCVVCALIHQIQMITLFPVVMACLGYRAYIEPGNRKKINIIAFYATVFIAVGLFVYIQFCSKNHLLIPYEVADKIMDERSQFEFVREKDVILKRVIYEDMDEHFNYYMNQNAENNGDFGYLKLLVSLLTMTPLVAMTMYAFWSTAKKIKESFPRFMCRLLSFAWVGYILCYILEIDYERWTYMFEGSLILLLLFLTGVQEMRDDGEVWYRKLGEKKTTYFLLGIWILLILVKDSQWSLFL